MAERNAEIASVTVMVVLSLTVAGPTLLGFSETLIPFGWWLAAWAVFMASYFGASILSDWKVQLGRGLFAIAVVSCWVVVLGSPHYGMLPVLLVTTAALAPYIGRLWLAALVIVLNTTVLVLMLNNLVDQSELFIFAGFYLLIQIATALLSATVVREYNLRGELMEAHTELRAASALLAESARGNERLRIARELHDLAGHNLTALRLELEASKHQSGEQMRHHVAQADNLARDLLDDVRSTVSELREGDIDLAKALNEVASDLPGIRVSVDVAPDIEVDSEQGHAIVRAAQEILTNAVRHARASSLELSVLRTDDGLMLTGVDNGIGSKDPQLGNGLRGLTERFQSLGGAVKVDGSNGFRVTAQVPAS